MDQEAPVQGCSSDSDRYHITSGGLGGGVPEPPRSEFRSVRCIDARDSSRDRAADYTRTRACHANDHAS